MFEISEASEPLNVLLREPSGEERPFLLIISPVIDDLTNQLQSPDIPVNVPVILVEFFVCLCLIFGS